MKRALILAMVGVMAFSAVALGGFNFGVQQNVDVFNVLYPLEAYVGYDFEAKYIDMGPLSIAGDITLSRSDLWTITGVYIVDGSLTFSYLDDVDLIASFETVSDFASMPTGFNLTSWTHSLEIVGHINEVLDIFAGVDLDYRPVQKDFLTSFFFGFDAAW